MSIQFDTVLPSLLSIYDNNIIVYSAIAVIMAASLFYIKNKAKSGFFIVNRLWVFWHGYKKENRHDLIDDIIEIERFNYCYNTDAVSIKQKKKFEDWIVKYELNFRLIAKLKSNLIIDTLKIKRIHIALPIFTFFSIFFSLYFLVSVFIVAIKPAALVNVDNTGWFWINKKEALEYRFLGSVEKAWLITPEKCKEKTDIVITPPPKTVDIICNSFVSRDALDYIDKVIEKQRLIFGISSIIFLFFSIFLFMQTVYLVITYDARKMVFLKIKKYRFDRMKQINQKMIKNNL